MSLVKWMDMALEHGTFFDLVPEGIVGGRENNDLYEMYFIDTKGQQHVLYFEIYAYETFQKLFNEMQWGNFFFTKYISLFSKKPTFYLKCCIKEHVFQYHFYLDEEVNIYLWVRNKQNQIVRLEEVPHMLYTDIKKLHRYVESYIRHHVSTVIVTEKHLTELLQQPPIEE